MASKAKGLSRFSELLDAVKLVMEEKDKDYPELSDPKWIMDLVVFGRHAVSSGQTEPGSAG